MKRYDFVLGTTMTGRPVFPVLSAATVLRDAGFEPGETVALVSKADLDRLLAGSVYGWNES